MMTFAVNPWVVIAVLSLALFGVVFVWRVARDAARDARAWWRDRRAGLNEDGLCAGCLGSEHCDGANEACICTCTWPEDWAEEDDLPPERSAEALGFTTPRRSQTFLERLEARRERLASAAELEHRAAYEACGFDYPSGLMARVREAAP